MASKRTMPGSALDLFAMSNLRRPTGKGPGSAHWPGHS